MSEEYEAWTMWMQSLPSAAMRSDAYCLRVDIQNRDRLNEAIRDRWERLSADLPHGPSSPLPEWLSAGVAKADAK